MPHELHDTGPGGPQKAFLVALDIPRRDAGWTAEESLVELALLAGTAGALVVGSAAQRRAAEDPATCIGEGKAREVEAQRRALGADLVIFDQELSPVHQRNLEKLIECAVLDRSALILDVFAQRARSREAKLQVELAQLQYRLTRLTGRGVDLSRLGGGIGTRGPGETKLEVDRRRIRARISHLRRELGEVAQHRERLRQDREARRVPVVALTGYTNAGKSTLHRALAGSDVLAEDRLFATLDATARRVQVPDGEPYILVDTVGFVNKLPHQLVAAFRSTLEEVTAADLIVHVVDAAHPKRAEQMATVQRVLADLEAAAHPQLVVYNKIDLVPGLGERAHLLEVTPGAVAVSALTGDGLGDLQGAIQQSLRSRRTLLEVLVPYRQGALLAVIHRHGRVLAEEHRPEGTWVQAELEKSLAARLRAELAADPENRQ